MTKWLLRFILSLAALLVATALFVWANFDWVRFNAVVWLTTPSETFDKLPTPRAFDYASDESWAALPTRADGADEAVEGEVDGQPDAAVDVFFVHGTTYGSKDSWNQSADDKDTNALTTAAMRTASPFNSCCKIHAPRFRQATLGSFMDTTGNGAKAIAFAYADVERAFDHFLAHHSNGRPFILAGASQGGAHVFRLLKDRITGTDLAKRMVAAYPLIWWMNRERFERDVPDLPVCGSPTQTGCVATFNPVGPNVRVGLNPLWDQTGIICVNPLTWRTDGAYAGFELNIGTRTFKTPKKLIPGMADAQCDENGRLVVSEIRTDIYDGIPLMRSLRMGVFGRENYHSVAIGLFYGNIRRNAKTRVDAFLAAEAQPKTVAQP